MYTFAATVISGPSCQRVIKQFPCVPLVLLSIYLLWKYPDRGNPILSGHDIKQHRTSYVCFFLRHNLQCIWQLDIENERWGHVFMYMYTSTSVINLSIMAWQAIFGFASTVVIFYLTFVLHLVYRFGISYHFCCRWCWAADQLIWQRHR